MSEYPLVSRTALYDAVVNESERIRSNVINIAFTSICRRLHRAIPRAVANGFNNVSISYRPSFPWSFRHLACDWVITDTIRSKVTEEFPGFNVSSQSAHDGLGFIDLKWHPKKIARYETYETVYEEPDNRLVVRR